MAKIIAEAGVRLRSVATGLGPEMRRDISKALAEATAGQRVKIDVDRDHLQGQLRSAIEAAAGRALPDGASNPIRRRVEEGLRGAFSRVQAIAGPPLRALGNLLSQTVLQGGRLVLIGAAATAAGAGVANLIPLVASLSQALGTAAVAGGAVFAASLAGLVSVIATLKIGTSGVGDALKDAFDPSKAQQFNQELKQLSPTARQFVLDIRKLGPAFHDMKLEVQNNLFAGLGKTISNVATKLLPIMKSGFGGLALVLNQAAREMAGVITNSANLAKLKDTSQNITQGFARLTQALAPLTDALITVVNVGSSLLPRVGGGLAGLAQRFDDFIQKAAASGRLKEIFESGLAALKQLGSILSNVGHIIHDVFSAARVEGGGVLDTLQKITGAVRDFTSSPVGQAALQNFFRATADIARALGPIILAAVDLIANTLAPLLAQLVQILAPAVKTAIDALGSALQAAGPGLQLFAKGIADFVAALAPALPAVGQFFGTFLGFVGQILQGLGPSFSDFIKKLAEALTSVFSNTELRDGLIKAGKAFLDLGKALIPLIGPLGKLATALLPPLVDALKAATVIATPLVKLIGFLVEKITALGPAADIAVPAIGALAVAFGGATTKGIGFFALFDIEKIPDKITKFTNSAHADIAERLPSTLDAAGSAFHGWVDEVKKAMEDAAKGVTDGTGAIGSSVTGIVEPLGQAGSAAGGNFLVSIGGQLGAATNQTSGWMDSIKQLVFGIITPLGQAGSAAGGAFTAGLGGGLGSAIDQAGAIVSGVRAALSQDFSAAGSALTRSFAAGMVGSAALAAVRSASLAVAGAAGSALPHSPAEVGPFSGTGWTPYRGASLVQGFAEGMLRASGVAQDAARQVMASVAAPLGAAPGVSPTGTPSTGAPGGGPTTVINQTNVMQPGMDGQQFADLVAARSAQKLKGGLGVRQAPAQPVQAGIGAPLVGVRP